MTCDFILIIIFAICFSKNEVLLLINVEPWWCLELKISTAAKYLKSKHGGYLFWLFIPGSILGNRCLDTSSLWYLEMETLVLVTLPGLYFLCIAWEQSSSVREADFATSVIFSRKTAYWCQNTSCIFKDLWQ